MSSPDKIIFTVSLYASYTSSESLVWYLFASVGHRRPWRVTATTAITTYMRHLRARTVSIPNKLSDMHLTIHYSVYCIVWPSQVFAFCRWQALVGLSASGKVQKDNGSVGRVVKEERDHCEHIITIGCSLSIAGIIVNHWWPIANVVGMLIGYATMKRAPGPDSIHHLAQGCWHKSSSLLAVHFAIIDDFTNLTLYIVKILHDKVIHTYTSWSLHRS